MRLEGEERSVMYSSMAIGVWDPDRMTDGLLALPHLWTY